MNSFSHLSPGQRRIIDLGLLLEKPVSEIAHLTGRHRSTIYREIKRNSDKKAGYSDLYAHQCYRLRRLEGGPRRKIRGPLKKRVVEALQNQWSPEQISGRERLEGKPPVATETIYRFIYRDRQKGGLLWRNLRLCRPQRKRRFPRHTWRVPRPGLDQRPAGANERSELGHYERDLIEGPRRHGGQLLVLTDRRSRRTHIVPTDRKTAREVHQATLKALKDVLVRSLTNDNGSEFVRFRRTSRVLRVPIFFTRPYASWERGTVENTNGLIRQYFPKKLNLKEIPHEFFIQVAKKLNQRPRKTLGYLTPIEFEARELKKG